MSEDNAEQIEHWNGEGGRRWVKAQARMDALLSPLTRILLERAAPRPGERVLDVGCGCGDTSVAIAELGADVVGVDVSAPMLERARARGAGRERLRFVHADAAEHPFSAASFELLLSRFGVMFFADPVGAFANLRRGHVEGGRLCFVCWQAPVENPWLTVPLQAALPFAPEAVPTPAPGAPGPFGLADPRRVTAVLEAAGYRDVAVEPYRVRLRCGEDLDDALESVVRLGPTSRLLEALPSEAQQAAIGAVREALRPFQTPEGVLLGSASWLVTARA
jgi:SAM-dependent methyltransferase